MAKLFQYPNKIRNSVSITVLGKPIQGHVIAFDVQPVSGVDGFLPTDIVRQPSQPRIQVSLEFTVKLYKLYESVLVVPLSLYEFRDKVLLHHRDAVHEIITFDIYADSIKYHCEG